MVGNPKSHSDIRIPDQIALCFSGMLGRIDDLNLFDLLYFFQRFPAGNQFCIREARDMRLPFEYDGFHGIHPFTVVLKYIN